MTTTTTSGYRERLHVPLRWWVQGIMLIATLWLALVVAIPELIAWGVTLVCLALLAAFFTSYGGSEITVAGGELRVGRAHIAGAHLGGVMSLDAEQTRRTAGVEADVRAFLTLRPYLDRAVRVNIDDPLDPTPYWLISTRHPDRLAVAIGELVQKRS